jgi:hypothetical protein
MDNGRRHRFLQYGSRIQWRRLQLYAAEWLVILVLAYLYSGPTLLDPNPRRLQQTGEHNESATLPLLAEIGLKRYGEIPLWNHYMLTGFPHAGDPVNHFWNPVATLPVLVWGGIAGMRISVFISFFLAGAGQWWLAHTLGARGVFRLWAALLFMLSGGLALLWRLGWYELLVGAAWFPWCFAALWWALHRRDRASLAVAAFCAGMVLTTGGGYYPLYLFVCLSVLVIMALLWSQPGERRPIFWRAGAVALLSAGLAAVALLPLAEGYRLIARDTLPDLEQRLAQPVLYALLNYVISAPEWFGTDVLGKGSGWTWLYIGALPFVALAFLPLAYSRARWRRPALATLAILFLTLLLWQANRQPPGRWIYDWLPFLYTFRFPNRLLIFATIPLLVLAALGLQFCWLAGRRSLRAWQVRLARSDSDVRSMPLRGLLSLALLLVMALSVRDVYQVNREFGFARQEINPTAYRALAWLKAYDRGVYYTSAGWWDAIYWDWSAAAYDLEMPLINFHYNRRLASMRPQREAESPFTATARYAFVHASQPPPEQAQLVSRFDEVGLWRFPEALPFAFAARSQQLDNGRLVSAAVQPFAAALDGPNRIVVTGQAAGENDQLVVLTSHYPGWRLFVNGEPAAIRPANGYLGAALRPGEHSYTFVFRPASYRAGLALSALTLLLSGGLVLAESPWRPRRLAASARSQQQPDGREGQRRAEEGEAHYQE